MLGRGAAGEGGVVGSGRVVEDCSLVHRFDYLGEDLAAYGTLVVEVMKLDQEDCDFSVHIFWDGLADVHNLEIDLEMLAEDQEGRV